MWFIDSKPNLRRSTGSEKRRRFRSLTAQKAVLCSNSKFVYRILDLSSTGAKLKGPELKEIFSLKRDRNQTIEFLIHYGGSQYKKVRGLVKWSELSSQTFGIQFLL